MTTRYNPNDGTGRWYEDAGVKVAPVVKEEINWTPVILALITSAIITILMVI